MSLWLRRDSDVDSLDSARSITDTDTATGSESGAAKTFAQIGLCCLCTNAVVTLLFALLLIAFRGEAGCLVGIIPIMAGASLLCCFCSLANFCSSRPLPWGPWCDRQDRALSDQRRKQGVLGVNGVLLLAWLLMTGMALDIFGDRIIEARSCK